MITNSILVKISAYIHNFLVKSTSLLVILTLPLVSTSVFSSGGYSDGYIDKTYVVKNTHDSGANSLRKAIKKANKHEGRDRIKFKIPGCGPNSNTTKVCKIQLQSDLPIIRDSIVIDGSIHETRQLPGNPTKRPGIHIQGLVAQEEGDPFASRGLTLSGPKSGNSLIRGLIISDLVDTGSTSPETASGSAVYIILSNGNKVVGNYFGTNKKGKLKGDGKGTAVYTGVDISDGSYNTVGGDHPNDRNVIHVDRSNPSGFVFGVLVGAFEADEGKFSIAKGNVVKGNYIGINANGASPPGVEDDDLERAVGIDMEAVGGYSFSLCTKGCVVTDTLIENNHVANLLAGISIFTLDFILSDEPDDPAIVVKNALVRNNVIHSNYRSGFSLTGEARDSVFTNNLFYNNGTDRVFTDYAGFTIRPPLRGFENQVAKRLLIKNNVFDANINGLQFARGENILVVNNVIKNSRDSAVALTDFRATDIDDPVCNLSDYPASASTPVKGITLLSNKIFNNQPNMVRMELPGIELSLADDLVLDGDECIPGGQIGGLNLNDVMDPDINVNNYQNHPTLTQAKTYHGGSVLKVSGSLNSIPDTYFLLEFFANSKAQQRTELISEGEKPMGFKIVKTDGNGDASFSKSLLISHGLPDCSVDEGPAGNSCITATAIRINTSGGHDFLTDTSEFSPAILVE